ncbi:hypothetical protein LTR84_001065 [Exophiala bonariae]|uniref:DNA2/NAM7 helicase-like C-terminal domain-containing protein n=1 Tax=Exophiala bonariae TaxID=1690606 RepID=A0AAV9NVS6_9EURO|nr:hypothetical protein LTR84_001065 [Exophiala bonariae]
MAARKELVNCFNCSASGQVCDRTRHRCLMCLQTTKVCRGYPRDLQWLSGVKSRGKEKGKALSVETSRGQWQSTTPINHAFVFKQGKPRKKRRQNFKEPSTTSFLQTSSPKSPAITESNDWCNLARAGVDDIFSIELSNTIWDGPDSVSEDFCDIPGTSIDWASLTLSSPCTTVNNTMSLMVQSFPRYQEDNQDESETSYDSQYSDLTSQLLLPSLESSTLLTWYAEELCTVPLTSDFQENPLRCERVSLNGPKYLLHAVLAISMQHVYRANDQCLDESVAQTIISYKNSATQLCQKALIDARGRLNTSVIDAILVLFTLDTLESAEGPWKERLSAALCKIAALNDILGIASSSARFRAQLGLFIWWDCSVALVARSEPVFPSQYYDAILAHDDSATWSIFTLSGVPRELFKYTRELASMAAEKEQTVGLKYVKFDLSRVTEISHCIRAYSVGRTEYPGAADNDELVQHWHDICNAGNAWKYALLLYVSRVFNWNRTTDSHLAEVTSFSRLVLDSVRCCRADSPLQKQLLFPVFLAGSECVDRYGQDFVTLFCEEWYRKCRYTMFREALVLLRQIWARREQEINPFGIWWGLFVGGGHHINEGCPGAGKTHFAAEIDKVIADHDTHLGPILHACPSNENVNSLAKKLGRRLGRSRRVIRLHSPGTEQQLTRHALRDMIPERGGRKPQAGLLVDPSDLEIILRRAYDEHHTQKFAGVNDKRVADVNQSLAYHLARYVGVIYDEDLTAPNAEEIFEDFRHQFCQDYTALVTALSTACDNMMLGKVHGIERLHAGTVDSLIGQDFNHVILVMPMQREGPGFLADGHRMCMATSRARDSLTVFATLEESTKMKKPPTRLCKFFDLLDKYGGFSTKRKFSIRRNALAPIEPKLCISLSTPAASRIKQHNWNEVREGIWKWRPKC